MVKTVGGTLAAQICGLSKRGGPLAAYFELVADVQAEQQPQMSRGNVLEESVLRLWVEREGLDPAGLIRSPWADVVLSPALPHAHARLDAWYEGPFGRVLIEAKTLAVEQAGPEWGPDGSDRIDLGYHAQAMWYHGVCRAAGLTVDDVLVLPVLVGPEAELQWAARLVEKTGRPLALADLAGTGLELRAYRVAWDPAAFAAMNARVLRFLREHVEPRIPPEPGEGDEMKERDVRAVARGLKSEPGVVKSFDALTPAEQAVLLELLEASKQRKAWTKLEDQAVARAQLLLGAAEEVTGLPGGGRISWKTTKAGSRRFEVREPRR